MTEQPAKKKEPKQLYIDIGIQYGRTAKLMTQLMKDSYAEPEVIEEPTKPNNDREEVIITIKVNTQGKTHTNTIKNVIKVFGKIIKIQQIQDDSLSDIIRDYFSRMGQE